MKNMHRPGHEGKPIGHFTQVKEKERTIIVYPLLTQENIINDEVNSRQFT